MNINTLKDLKEIKGKKILVRVDFNVPLQDDGKIQDDTRIQESLPTLKKLQQQGAKLIIMSHLGRPGGEVNESLRLTEVAKHLSKLLSLPVNKLNKTIGEQVTNEIGKMNDGEILMLENTRFNKGEKSCNEDFTKKLAALGDIFVNDAFGTAHRKHASTAGIAKYIPAYAGLLMEKEINALSPIVNEEPGKPLTVVFGGAKIDTKIGVIKNFLDKADYFLIGGALANTFLAAAGYNVAKSLYQEDKIKTAREIMLLCEKNKEKFVIPHDTIVASEISDEAETLHIPIEDVMGDMKILDIGKWTAEKYAKIVEKSKTVIWNGPLGLCEHKQFQNGTKTVAETLAKSNCTSIIGGGDTIDALNRLGMDHKKFTHISTGGGASLEFLAGDSLPGIEVLKK